MAEEGKPEREILSGENALALWRQGKDAWNARVHEHKGLEVDFQGVEFKAKPGEQISFSGYQFPGHAIFNDATFGVGVSFHGATFGGVAGFSGVTFDIGANFMDATFNGVASFSRATSDGMVNFMRATFNDTVSFNGATFDFDKIFVDATFDASANFEDATFDGGVSFQGATFGGPAEFSRAKFNGGVWFNGGKFEGPVTLDGSRFLNVPDLRQTILDAHVTLHGMEVSYETRRKGFLLRQAKEPDAADKLRRLKQLAIDAKDHKRELAFLADEFRTERFHETTGIRLIPNYLYDWLSDFGRSLWRPAFGLLLVWLAGAQIMAPSTSKGLLLQPSGHEALLVSAGNLLPFIGGSRAAIARKEKLFPGGVPTWVDTLGIIQGLLAAIFIFLIGLALRNRFRL